jgi:hypothetical protein
MHSSRIELSKKGNGLNWSLARREYTAKHIVLANERI